MIRSMIFAFLCCAGVFAAPSGLLDRTPVQAEATEGG